MKIDAQYKATVVYYRWLLPLLFEKNVIIVLTNFPTDHCSVGKVAQLTTTQCLFEKGEQAND